MGELVFGTTLLASFLGGVVALLALCCGDGAGHPGDTEQGRELASSAGVMFAPGVLIDGEPFSHGRLSERELRRTLDKRRLRAPRPT